MFDRVSQPSAIDVLGTLDIDDLRDSDDEVLLRSCFVLGITDQIAAFASSQLSNLFSAML